MERVVAGPRQRPIDRDEILDAAHFAGQDDAVTAEAQFFRPAGAADGRFDHGAVHHGVRVDRCVRHVQHVLTN